MNPDDFAHYDIRERWWHEKQAREKEALIEDTHGNARMKEDSADLRRQLERLMQR